MTDELKPVRCGCGGEAGCFMTHYWGKCFTVQCLECGIETKPYDTEAEAVQAWNRAMGSAEKSSTVERTAKVIEHDASVTDTDGYKYHRSEYLCGACKKKVLGGDEYCSHCGCRLDWNEDIPMEYFESGGR
jgi:hypothetical protein